MPNETGHAKNVANFVQAINIVKSIGSKYKPNNNLISVNQLEDLLNQAQNAVATVANNEAGEDVAVDERQKVFEKLSKLTTRVGNAVSVSVSDQLFDQDFRSIQNKVTGKRASAKPKVAEGATETPKSISASQMSYDSRVQNFAEMIALLKTQTAYAPNETELQTASLETYLADMQTKNAAANNASLNVANARAERNGILYNETEGVLARIALVKKYVKSLGDAEKTAYQQLVALKFSKPSLK